MKYEERLLQVRTSIADTQRSDEERRRAREQQRPSRMRNVILGGGPHLLWKIPLLITSVAFFIMFPNEIIRYGSKYLGVPNWVLNFVPGVDNNSSLPGPLALATMGFAAIGIIAGGMFFYVYIRRAQNPRTPW